MYSLLCMMTSSAYSSHNSLLKSLSTSRSNGRSHLFDSKSLDISAPSSRISLQSKACMFMLYRNLNNYDLPNNDKNSVSTDKNSVSTSFVGVLSYNRGYLIEVFMESLELERQNLEPSLTCSPLDCFCGGFHISGGPNIS